MIRDWTPKQIKIPNYLHLAVTVERSQCSRGWYEVEVSVCVCARRPPFLPSTSKGTGKARKYTAALDAAVDAALKLATAHNKLVSHA